MQATVVLHMTSPVIVSPDIQAGKPSMQATGG